jgi:hypothetical protein
MTSYVLKSDIKRALSGRGFFIGAAGMALTILLASLEGAVSFIQAGALPNGWHAQLFLDALASDAVTLILPVVCALSFTAAFIDDMKSGFIKEYLHRSGVSAYIRGKLTACALSGALTLVLGALAAYAIMALALTPLELARTDGEGATQSQYLANIVSACAMLLLSGALWSLLGFTLAALTMSRYIAYASPFILYYVLIILHERYFQALYVLYPKEWIFPSGTWAFGRLGVLLLLAELIAVICLIFVVTAKRRLANV